MTTLLAGKTEESPILLSARCCIGGRGRCRSVESIERSGWCTCLGEVACHRNSHRSPNRPCVLVSTKICECPSFSLFALYEGADVAQGCVLLRSVLLPVRLDDAEHVRPNGGRTLSCANGVCDGVIKGCHVIWLVGVAVQGLHFAQGNSAVN